MVAGAVSRIILKARAGTTTAPQRFQKCNISTFTTDTTNHSSMLVAEVVLFAES
jgi:hypothetical protein